MKRQNGFLRASAMVLTAGAAAVLAGVGRLLQGSRREAVAWAEPLPVAALPAPESLKTERHFSIKRTKSEVGYVYWILEGYGKYKCFVLCDSWDDAVAEAKARLAAEEPNGSPVTFATGE